MSKKRVLADDDLRDIVDSHIAQKKKTSSSVSSSPSSSGGGMKLPDGLSEQQPSDFNFAEESASRPVAEPTAAATPADLPQSQINAPNDLLSIGGQQPVGAKEAHDLSSKQSLLTNNEDRPLWQKVTDFVGVPEFNEGVATTILDVADAGATIVDDAMGGAYTAITGKPYTTQKSNIFKDWSDSYKKDIERVTPIRKDDPSYVRDVYSGLVQTAPLILATAMTGGENLAAQTPQVISHLTKFLAATGALKGYGEARHNDEDIASSIKNAGVGGVKGAVEGLTLEAMMMVGKAAGKGGAKALAEKGLLVGGEITQKALEAIGVGTAFAGSSVGQNVLDGQEIDWDNAKKQFGMGLAFEATPVLKAAGTEIREGVRNRRIDNGIIKNIANNRNETKVLNFLKATPEQIDGILAMPKSADELFADATEIGIKAGETKDVREKTNGYLTQVGLINASDIKSVSEDIVADPTKFIDAISASDLPAEGKQELIDKVNQIHKTYNPTEQAKTAIGDKITANEEMLKQTGELQASATDPVSQIEAEVTAKNITGENNSLRKDLTGVVEEQMAEQNKRKEAEVQARQVDATVLDFQSKFPEQVPDPLSEISEGSLKTLNRVDADTPTDLIAINEASDELYQKYKQLAAMKVSDKRLMTTDQINDAMDLLEQDITMLETHKQKYHAEEAAIEESPVTEIANEKELVPETPGATEVEAQNKIEPVEAEVQEPIATEEQPDSVSELAEPKAYGYEDIDAMTDVKEVADNLSQEIRSPSELSPKEQAIREAGGFTTTPESYAQFGDRNNQGNQMAKSYFRKDGMSLDKIAQSLSKDGLEITPADLKDYMERFPDGNTTYSGRAKALQEKLFDMTGKKYNKATVEKLRTRMETEAIKKVEANPEVLDNETLNVIESEGITAENIDQMQDKLEFIFGKDVFDNIREYLNGEEPGQSVPEETGERGKVLNESGNESIPEKERGIPRESEATKNESTRTVEEVIADQKDLVKRYQDILREKDLYELAKNGLADPVDIEMAKQEAEADFGKTVEELKAERERLESKPDEETIEPAGETKPAAEEPAVATEGIGEEVKSSEAETDKEAPIADERKPEEKSIADKIRSLKTKRSAQLNDGIIGIPIAFYDGALETIATAIEAGASIAEALKRGIDYIKKNTEVQDDALIEEQFRKELEDAGLILKGTDQENPVPEVLEEIAKSPEDIATESINDFKKRLDRILKKSNMQTLVKTGMVKSDLAFDAVKKVADITDHKTMLEAGRAVKKLFRNLVENTYRSQLREAKTGLDRRLKGSRLAKTDLMKKFMKIDDRNLSVDDLERYNALARQLNDQYNARLDSVVSDTEIQKFVDHIADLKAQEVLDRQLKKEAQALEDDHDRGINEEPLVKEKRESERRKQLDAAVTINRQELKKGQYSDQYKDVAQALLRIDTKDLSNKEMLDLNMALINMGVNDRLVSHSGIYKKYVGETNLEIVKERLGDNIRGLLESVTAAGFRTLDVNTKIIFKGIKDSALFQHLSGIAGISNGNSKVTNIDMKGIEREYKTFLSKIDMDKEGSTTENRFLRALYSNATQFSGISGEAKDFTRYKSLIQQSFEKLTASKDPAEQREGKLRQEQYEQYLEPFETREEFENNFQTQQPKNAQVVDFFREKFAEKFPLLKANTEIYGGKNLKEVNNYLPMKWKRYSGTEVKQPGEINDIVEPIFDFDPETGDVSEKQSSTTIERTNKSKIKNSDRILDMDFDKYIFEKYREMNYDIRTLKDRHLFNAIRGQEGFAEFTGSPRNADILTTGVKNMVKREMGGSRVDEEINPILRASRILSGKGVRQALFGAAQLLKQYPSVAIRTMTNLNSDIPLFLKGVGVGMNNPIFDHFGVGLRGTTKGGTNYEVELNKIRKSDFSSDIGKLTNALNRVSKLGSDKLSTPLSYSDDAVAKHSWIAYYLQHIKQNGGDANKVDWETEHLNPNEEAGAYADLMVSTTQNTNDNSKQANLLYDNNDAKTMFRDIVAPFSSFARNSQANLEADLRTFSGGTAAEKKTAAWGIISNVSEQIAFNSIKVAIGAYIVNKGSEYIQELLGYDVTPKDPTKGAVEKIAKNSASDILFGGLGQLGSYWAIKGVNQVNKSIQGDGKDFFYQFNPAQYGDPDFGVAGIYGILPQSLYNAGQKADYLDGELTGFYRQKGVDYKSTVNLSAKDQAVVSTLFLMDALAIAGLSDAELSRMNQTMFRDIKKKTQPVKKFTVETLNKKAGATREEIKDEE